MAPTLKPKRPTLADGGPPKGRPRRISGHTITPAKVAAMDPERARGILADEPNLPTRLRVEGTPELADALEARAAAREPAPAPAAPAAAQPGAKDRAGSTRPRGSGRRSTSGRRLGSRIVRETPGLPGPSATGLVLSFIGSTAAVIGLVLLVGSGSSLGFLPGALGTFTTKLLDPHDPIL